MGRLGELRVVDPVLTTIARGYSNAELIGTKIFPVVSVDKSAGKIPLFGKDQFKVYGAKRAIRGKSNRFDLGDLDTTSYSTNEYDLEVAIDYLESAESLINLEQKATNDVMQGLKLTQEKQIADLISDADNYPVANKVALTTGYHFDDDGVDPISYIDGKKSALRALIAKEPNTMVLSYPIFKALLNHAAIIDRLSTTALGLADINILKQIFGIENILVGKAVYLSDAGAITDVWGNNIVLMYNTNPTGIASSVYEPVTGYTLQLKGNPSVDKYDENGGKIHVVRATDNYDIKIVGIESAYLIKDVLK